MSPSDRRAVMSPSEGGAGTSPSDGGAGTSFEELVTASSILICAGPGGVGKTTIAAAVALEAARRGRRACVVTIDPAQRLADALGLEELTNDPHRVETGGEGPGELWALMLDTKGTFDALVTQYSASAVQAKIILANPFYRNISSALSGTQEYMAVEKLYELHSSGRFDLVVVDTPPTRHALDFLDAPRRLTRFLNNRIFRLLMMPTRAGLRAVNLATQLFMRTIAKVVGGEVVREAVAFFTAFEGMEQGFRERAERVEALLAAPATSYVLVAAPRRSDVEEATYFADRLVEASARVSAVIVNRMYPRFGPPVDPAPARTTTGFGALAANLADLDAIAGAEEVHVQALAGRTPGAVVVRVPFLVDEVHDLTGLRLVGAHLAGGI
jgi:anion-transporting  ArsA/GET3 family ATPase